MIGADRGVLETQVAEWAVGVANSLNGCTDQS